MSTQPAQQPSVTSVVCQSSQLSKLQLITFSSFHKHPTAFHPTPCLIPLPPSSFKNSSLRQELSLLCPPHLPSTPHSAWTCTVDDRQTEHWWSVSLSLSPSETFLLQLYSHWILSFVVEKCNHFFGPLSTSMVESASCPLNTGFSLLKWNKT